MNSLIQLKYIFSTVVFVEINKASAEFLNREKYLSEKADKKALKNGRKQLRQTWKNAFAAAYTALNEKSLKRRSRLLQIHLSSFQKYTLDCLDFQVQMFTVQERDIRSLQDNSKMISRILAKTSYILQPLRIVDGTDVYILR